MSTKQIYWLLGVAALNSALSIGFIYEDAKEFAVASWIICLFTITALVLVGFGRKPDKLVDVPAMFTKKAIDHARDWIDQDVDFAREVDVYGPPDVEVASVLSYIHEHLNRWLIYDAHFYPQNFTEHAKRLGMPLPPRGM